MKRLRHTARKLAQKYRDEKGQGFKNEEFDSRAYVLHGFMKFSLRELVEIAPCLGARGTANDALREFSGKWRNK